MATIEIESFFYDLFHCKDKLLESFNEWDEKYGEDERGALVAGIQECPNDKLINFLINVQKMATGYERIQEMINAEAARSIQQPPRRTNHFPAL